MDRETSTIRVGRKRLPFAKAIQSLKRYTDRSMWDPAKPFAYPAYDEYESGSNDPLKLSDADLLAPVLLNVSISVRSFYALQGAREDLEEGLANPLLDQPLTCLNDREVAQAVAPLYSVLDQPHRPSGIKGTKLSKVLHRKRPNTLVLHDQWVKACYLGQSGPVLVRADRSWADYMTELSCAMRDDLTTQTGIFNSLRDQVPTARPLTDLRLLDVLAWSLKDPADGVVSSGTEAGED